MPHGRTVMLFLLLPLLTIVPLTLSQDALADSSPDGAYEAWVARYAGPQNTEDVAADIGVDADGSVFVTGCSRNGYPYASPCPREGTILNDFATIKYDKDGVQQWARFYGSGAPFSPGTANALVVDSSGNVVVTGTAYSSLQDFNYVTIAYDTDGNQAAFWTYAADGTHVDVATDVAVDPSDRVYVTGWSSVDDQGDYATVAGDSAWVARYDSGDAYDDARAVAVDPQGNFYVTGRPVTVKYDKDGTELWVRDREGDDVTLDDSGNAYVTGPAGTCKYNGTGDEQWAAAAPGDDVDVDDAGNVYVTGPTTIKYNSAGVEQWTAPGAIALDVDPSGNVYVLKASTDAGTGIDYLTVMYDTGGNQQWAIRYDGPVSGNDKPVALVADDSGNVYVTGTSAGADGSWDYATIKYAPVQESPGPVGGLAEYDAHESQPAARDASSSLGGTAALGAAGATALLVVAGGFWYARRRGLRLR